MFNRISCIYDLNENDRWFKASVDLEFVAAIRRIFDESGQNKEI